MSALSSEPTSLYIHVPFCVVKCGYCDFNSFEVEDDAIVDRYLDALTLALQRELRQGDQLSPSTVFLGGGTPTHLDENRFERLLAIINAEVDLGSCAEVTMEANPESVTPAKAQLAWDAGVRRISIGAQSFDAERLRFLDRAHDADAITRAVEVFRQVGCNNLSLDLIFSLPGQTQVQWADDLARALDLEPDHLSCYNLTYEAGTKLTRAMTNGTVKPNDDTTDRALFDDTRSTLLGAGFEAYEVSNFAGRGGPCRHNDHYWLQGDYLGIGPGASSHRSGLRWTDLKPVDAWCRAIESGTPPVGEAEILTKRQRAAEALWLGIRRREGVALDRIADRIGVDPAALFAAELTTLATDGLLQLEDRWLRLTSAGLPFSDLVGSRLLCA